MRRVRVIVDLAFDAIAGTVDVFWPEIASIGVAAAGFSLSKVEVDALTQEADELASAEKELARHGSWRAVQWKRILLAYDVATALAGASFSYAARVDAAKIGKATLDLEVRLSATPSERIGEHPAARWRLELLRNDQGPLFDEGANILSWQVAGAARAPKVVADESQDARRGSARESFEKSWSVIRRILGKDEHPSVVAALHGLATAEFDDGQKDDAIRRWTEILAVERALYGSNHHVLYAASETVLVLALLSVDRLQEAVPHLVHAYAVFGSLAPEHRGMKELAYVLDSKARIHLNAQLTKVLGHEERSGDDDATGVPAAV